MWVLDVLESTYRAIYELPNLEGVRSRILLGHFEGCPGRIVRTLNMDHVIALQFALDKIVRTHVNSSLWLLRSAPL